MVSPGVRQIYKKLFRAFGRQHWWPADSAFEVMVGAILTQSTSWKNVEKALANLKKEKVLTAKKLASMDVRDLARLIRPAGYYNVKAGRLKGFLDFFMSDYSGNARRMASEDTSLLRSKLLGVKGIGPETADSILLYALNKPVFVVDAYTKRVLLRHGLMPEDAGYEKVQAFFMRGMKTDAKTFNEYHALIVKLGKEFCLKAKPRCGSCPLFLSFN